MKRFFASTFLLTLVLPLLSCLNVSVVFGDDEAEAIRKAVSVVLPRLVRIDTIGGHEKVGGEFANEGTSTGILLDRDGYVLTSAFNFLHDPASILLRFEDDSKKVARRIATDRNRMLTLLKVDGIGAESISNNRIPEKLDFRTKDSLRSGEPCIVVGIALSRDEPNIAVGIVSGKDRIWGKAIQTDAAIGPNNYGGAMIDRNGRLIGMAAPLSMMSNELTAGAETYDAGVGLAVPFEDIVSTVLPRLKEGKDLEPGTIGITLKENRIFVGEAVLDAVQPQSPAQQAGLQKGDKIVAVDGKPISSALELSINLRRRYAGDKLELTFFRNGEERTVSLTTVPFPEKQPKTPQEKKTEKTSNQPPNVSFF